MRWRSGDGSEAASSCFVEAVVREARDVGIHITFGPVADVNTNPLNPIISIRAFSDDAGAGRRIDGRVCQAGRGSLGC